ncbi:MAG: hypothetical protein O3A48_04405 [Actinomycetota bacterium]|nr:hypothetical protein [Actinomycetota bacterium]MDA3013761.1 hypothetical protein [Actinomycetota bacterium]
MKKIIVLMVVFINCSVSPSSSANNEITTTSFIELDECEKLELEYTNLSNELFNTSFELNNFIDNISPSNIDEDKDYFFENIDKNWNYQEIYLNYLEVRLKVYSRVNALYKSNTNCSISGDQEISLEQVEAAKNDLEDFKKKIND